MRIYMLSYKVEVYIRKTFSSYKRFYFQKLLLKYFVEKQLIVIHPSPYSPYAI